MKAEDCIFFQLAKASQAGVQFWNNRVSHLNLTGVQAMVLVFMGDEDNITSGYLGDRVRLTSATLTGIVDRLEKMNLVQRKPSPTDRRATLLSLTKKGSEIVSKLYQILPEANKDFLQNLSREEEKLLRKNLITLREQEIIDA